MSHDIQAVTGWHDRRTLDQSMQSTPFAFAPRYCPQHLGIKVNLLRLKSGCEMRIKTFLCLTFATKGCIQQLSWSRDPLQPGPPALVDSTVDAQLLAC